MFVCFIISPSVCIHFTSALNLTLHSFNSISLRPFVQDYFILTQSSKLLDISAVKMLSINVCSLNHLNHYLKILQSMRKSCGTPCWTELPLSTFFNIMAALFRLSYSSFLIRRIRWDTIKSQTKQKICHSYYFIVYCQLLASR